MAYVVLAIGALVALAGLASMVAGYPMIEIERGWATVIAGAVLFSGGVVTMALGLVVRALVQGGHRASVEVPFPTAGPPPASIDADLPPVETAAPPRVSPGYGPAFAVAAPSAAAAIATDELWSHAEDTPQVGPIQPTPSPHAPAPAHDLDADREVHSFAPPLETWTPPEPELPPEPEPEPEPEPVKPAPVAPLAASPASPLESREEWLNEAFSAFNYEMAASHPVATEPAHEPELHEEPLAVPEPEPHEAPTAQDEPEPPEQPAAFDDHPPAATSPSATTHAPASDLTIIGRYDSDGTSYVMYSDGSIEAQSEAGIYRFGSMAELKAFIEG